MPLARLIGRSAFVLVLVFFALTMLPRTQPEHHDTLESLLIPPAGCTMPCFLGIRIGHTHAAEAVQILQAHPWIDHVEHIGAGDRQVSSIRFRWSPDAPRYVGSFRDNILETAYDTEQVSAITLHLFIPTGDIWRFLTTHTADGDPLARHIHVDGANCRNNPMAFYSATSDRLYYRARAQPNPYIPVRERPRAFRC